MLGCLVGMGCLGAAGAEPREMVSDSELALRVIVLANRGDPDSLRIAQHYAAVRGVPAINVIALPMPAAETIGWQEFVTQIWEPLESWLVSQRWIDAIPMTLTDAVGRTKYAVNSHRIAALVVCRGVPLRVAHDPALYSEVPPYTAHGEFRTNAAAVDAELALLAMPNHPINAFVPNPLFQNDRPSAFDRNRVVQVSRLDGPTVDDALGLIDHALEAEQNGLLGRAYIDLSDRDAVGNEWLERAAVQLKTLGFDTTVDREPPTMSAAARADAPVLYFGWYAGDVDGPFALKGFRFPPGAVALHIHSYSATTLRSQTNGWTGPFVAHGVTATVGNVYEPYLQLTHRPDLLVRALARGATLAEAGFYALQALSWQEILIGDPLYRPFAVSLDDQLRNAEKVAPELAEYAWLRKARLLDAAGQNAVATALLRERLRSRPSLVVAVELSRRLRDAGDTAGAASALATVPPPGAFAPDQWALVREAANLMAASGRPMRSVEWWRALLGDKDLPRELRAAWLKEAARAARDARQAADAISWQREADELAVPAPPP